MPLLGERGKNRIILKEATKIAKENVWVDIIQTYLLEDTESIKSLPENASAEQIMENTREQCAKIILDWNFVDANGNKAVITPENMRKVPIKDLTEILQQVNADTELNTIKKNN